MAGNRSVEHDETDDLQRNNALSMNVEFIKLNILRSHSDMGSATRESRLNVHESGNFVQFSGQLITSVLYYL